MAVENCLLYFKKMTTLLISYLPMMQLVNVITDLN